jgi:hypothetical protein
MGRRKIANTYQELAHDLTNCRNCGATRSINRKAGTITPLPIPCDYCGTFYTGPHSILQLIEDTRPKCYGRH